MQSGQLSPNKGSTSAVNEPNCMDNSLQNEEVITIDDNEIKSRDPPRKSGISQLFSHLICCSCFSTEHNSSKYHPNLQDGNDRSNNSRSELNGKKKKVDANNETIPKSTLPLKDKSQKNNSSNGSSLAQNISASNGTNSGFRDCNDRDSQASDHSKIFRIHAEREKLLPPLSDKNRNKKCFIIDLDETLVHSSFKYVKTADINVIVEIDGVHHEVFVCKRPFVDDFLSELGDLFECVLFTASLGKYADPVTDFLDPNGIFEVRLFREACAFREGNYVKDLNAIGRDLDQIIILDNSPVSYLLNPRNALQIVSWFDDTSDTALKDLIPYFKDLAASPLSVTDWLQKNKPPESAGILGHPPSNLHWILMQTLSVPEALSIYQQRSGESCDSSASCSSAGSRQSITSPPTDGHETHEPHEPHEPHHPHHGMITQALKMNRRKSQAALDDECNRPPVSSPVARPSSVILLGDDDDNDLDDEDGRLSFNKDCEISDDKILYHSTNEDSSLSNDNRQ